jgi:hypothetical protein
MQREKRPEKRKKIHETNDIRSFVKKLYFQSFVLQKVFDMFFSLATTRPKMQQQKNKGGRYSWLHSKHTPKPRSAKEEDKKATYIWHNFCHFSFMVFLCISQQGEFKNTTKQSMLEL